MSDGVRKSVQPVKQTRRIDLGDALRARRTGLGLSQRELSRRSGLTHAAISQIEQNKVSPTVASLRKLATALGSSLGELFRSETASELQVFFNSSELLDVGTGSVSQRLVGTRFAGSTLQVLVERYPPGADTGPEMLVRDAEYGGVVIRGAVRVTVGKASRVLGPGDAYLLPRTLPHRVVNEGDEVCEIVSASTPPSL